LLRLPDLDQGKGDQKHKSEHKQCDDTPLIPLDAVSSVVHLRKMAAVEEYSGLDSQHKLCHPIATLGTSRQHRAEGQAGRGH
jgi:hypothetical protein